MCRAWDGGMVIVMFASDLAFLSQPWSRAVCCLLLFLLLSNTSFIHVNLGNLLLRMNGIGSMKQH